MHGIDLRNKIVHEGEFRRVDFNLFDGIFACVKRLLDCDLKLPDIEIGNKKYVSGE